MLLRRLYQGIGYALFALAALSLIASLVNLFRTGDVGGLFLGAMLAALLAVSGFIVRTLATGPAEAGLHGYGVMDKAAQEKAKSTLPAARTAAK